MNREIGLVSYLGASPNWLFEQNTVAKWTPEENKRFENALALFDKDTPDRWHNVASMIPGKTVSDVVKQYRELVEDVSDIEAGLIPIPGYAHSSFTLDWMTVNHGKRTGPTRSNDHERKKGVPWTEEEHRQFLLGLKKYGKGDWRNISRNFVTSRTPTQVASHAQKYFIRQVSGGKDKRRSSIHDITTVHLDIKPPSPDTEGHDSPEKAPRSLDEDVVVTATYDTHQGGVNSNLTMSHLQGMVTSSSSLGLNVHHLHLDPYGLRLQHHVFR